MILRLLSAPNASTSESADAAETAAPDTRRTDPPHSIATHHNSDTLLTALQSLLSLVVVAMFIITFSLQPFRIPSGSMEPTLLIGDFLLVDKQAPEARSGLTILPPSGIRRGEIIVFHDPVDDTLHLVKRVVGVPGDHLRLRGGHVFINGQPLSEPYAIYRPGRPDDYRDNFPRLQSADPDIDSHWWIRLHSLVDRGDLVVPPRNYFVLGDNRNDSEDSRYWGFVPEADIVGRPFLVYLSLRLRGTRHNEIGNSQDLDAGVVAGSLGGRIAEGARWSRTLHVIH